MARFVEVREVDQELLLICLMSEIYYKRDNWGLILSVHICFV